MKCIKPNPHLANNDEGKIERVPNAEAGHMVRSGKFIYCGKEEYKEQQEKKK